jgi:hypothetical protein
VATAFGQIKTGGHKPISVSDEGVKDAEDFALEIKSSKMVQEISLDGIVKAERQSVARTNLISACNSTLTRKKMKPTELKYIFKP